MSQNSQKELMEDEVQIIIMFERDMEGILSEEEKPKLKELKREKRKLLEWEDLE